MNNEFSYVADVKNDLIKDVDSLKDKIEVLEHTILSGDFDNDWVLDIDFLMHKIDITCSMLTDFKNINDKLNKILEIQRKGDFNERV